MESAISYNEFQKLNLGSPYAPRQDNYYVGSERKASSPALGSGKTSRYHAASRNSSPCSPTDPLPKQVAGQLANTAVPAERTLSSSHDETTDPSIERIVQEMEGSHNPSFKNTYFFDGGSRFISLPSLGNSSTKGASQISRVFEEWLETKIYFHSSPDTVPILEESVSRCALDVMDKIRARSNRILNGLSKILVKIRVGHVYSYHDSEPAGGRDFGVEDDMAEFFQQFPLFVEVLIIVKPSEGIQPNPTTDVILAIENAGLNPAKPYIVREVFTTNEEARSCGAGRSPTASQVSL